MNYRATIRL